MRRRLTLAVCGFALAGAAFAGPVHDRPDVLEGLGVRVGNTLALPGLAHEYQRLNNCGPVTAKMTLSLYGRRVTQAAAADALKTSRLDRNVSVPEVAAYLERFGYRTVRRYGGSPALVRRLVSAGFPVVLHQQMKLTDDIGHYRVAYGVEAGAVVVGDSFLGPKVRLPDATFNRLGAPYGGEYLVVYRPAREGRVRALLGPDWQRAANVDRLERSMLARVEAAPRDALAWYSLGRARLLQERHTKAADAFERAQSLGLPKKHYWYQQEAFAAWNKAGRFELTRRVAARVLAAYPNSSETGYYYREALRALGRPVPRSVQRIEGLENASRL